MPPPACRHSLEEAGIAFGASPTTGEAPITTAEQVEIGSIPSPPLSEIAARALVDGTTAEMLFKEIGRRRGGDPIRAEGAAGVFFALLEEELPITIPSAPLTDRASPVRTVRPVIFSSPSWRWRAD